MATAAQTVLEPTERVRAQKRTRQYTPQYKAQSTRVPTGRARTQQERAEQTHPDGAGIHLHTRTFRPQVPIPYVSVEKLPAQDLVFYGGLGALAVVGALEWPVALAIGGATWLVRSRRKEGR